LASRAALSFSTIARSRSPSSASSDAVIHGREQHVPPSNSGAEAVSSSSVFWRRRARPAELDAREAVEHVRVLRPQPSRALQVVARLVELVLVAQQQPEPQVGLEVVGVRLELAPEEAIAAGRSPLFISATPRSECTVGQLRVELGGLRQVRHGLARVDAAHVLDADQQVPFGALAVPEQAVDHGLAVLEVVRLDERRAEQVGEQVVVQELPLAGWSRATTPASSPICSVQSASSSSAGRWMASRFSTSRNSAAASSSDPSCRGRGPG
jgi:hypothetical protein